MRIRRLAKLVERSTYSTAPRRRCLLDVGDGSQKIPANVILPTRCTLVRGPTKGLGTTEIATTRHLRK